MRLITGWLIRFWNLFIKDIWSRKCLIKYSLIYYVKLTHHVLRCLLHCCRRRDFYSSARSFDRNLWRLMLLNFGCQNADAPTLIIVVRCVFSSFVSRLSACRLAIRCFAFARSTASCETLSVSNIFNKQVSKTWLIILWWVCDHAAWAFPRCCIYIYIY